MERVLHITGSMDRAGAETMIMNLYRNIDRSQFQFDFVFFTEKESDYEKEIKSLGGVIHRINNTNPLSRILGLKKLLKSHPEYKIIHIHTLLSSSFYSWIAKISHIPNRIVHAHSTNDLNNRSLIGRIYKNFSINLIEKYGTHFIGCGIEPIKFLFPNKEDVLFLPNAIDTNHFATIGDLNQDYINKEFGTKDSDLKLIQIGRLQSVKNHRFSIKIAQELKEREIPFKMLFVGQGDLEDELRELIKSKNLTNEIELTGLRSDIPELLAGSDLMIMPSLYEGFPVVMVESQSVGTPALISDTIDPQVDLKLNLVIFESLNNPIESWVNKILNVKSLEKLDTSLRLQKLKEQGFDIYSSAINLTNLYLKMLQSNPKSTNK